MGKLMPPTPKTSGRMYSIIFCWRMNGLAMASSDMFLAMICFCVMNCEAVMARIITMERIHTATWLPPPPCSSDADSGAPKMVDSSNCLTCSGLMAPMPWPLALAGADAGEHLEQREEERHLDQHGQAGRERVGAVLLVQGHLFLRHGLAGELVGLALVLVLHLLQVRLQQLHAALGLDLLDEDRESGRRG